jgi:hypothetical protein
MGVVIRNARRRGAARLGLMTVSALLGIAAPARAQAPQQPLMTQAPETVGAGVVQFETGMDYTTDRTFTTSGLTGNLWRVPLITMKIGLGTIAELQFTGGLHDQLDITSRAPAPLASAVVSTGSTTADYDDIVVSTKVQLAHEDLKSWRPAFGLLFGTELPNAKPYSGLGQSTTNVTMSGIGAKRVGALRLVGNVGFGVLGDPINGHHHENVLEYGAAATHALRPTLEIVGEVNGRVDLGSAPPPPGDEDLGTARVGVRYARWRGWLAGAATFGLTSVDSGVGFAASYTFAFHLFHVS